MTGCPNGCARPYNCDIGLVGKAADKYTIFVGGRLLGDRLNFIYKDLVPPKRSCPRSSRCFSTSRSARSRRNLRRLLPPQRRRRPPAWAEQYASQAAPAAV